MNIATLESQYQVQDIYDNFLFFLISLKLVKRVFLHKNTDMPFLYITLSIEDNNKYNQVHIVFLKSLKKYYYSSSFNMDALNEIL